MEENQPLSLTVEVHDVLNAALIGRHVTCRLQSWQSDARIADPREFVNEIVSAARRLDHCGWDSPSVVERTNWINDGRLELATTIILAEGARNGAAAMEFTVRLDPYPTGMLITPAVLLRVEAPGEDQIPQDHNRRWSWICYVTWRAEQRSKRGFKTVAGSSPASCTAGRNAPRWFLCRRERSPHMPENRIQDCF
jgi:hypothetical protein